MADGSRSFNVPLLQCPGPLYYAPESIGTNSDSFFLPSTRPLRRSFFLGAIAEGTTLQRLSAWIMRLVRSSLNCLLPITTVLSIFIRSNKRIDCFLGSLFGKFLRPSLEIRWNVPHSSFFPELRGDHGGPFAHIFNVPPSSNLVKRFPCFIDAGENSLIDITNWSRRSTLPRARIRGSLQNSMTHLNIRDDRTQWRSKRVWQAVQIRKNETAAAGIERTHLLESYLKQTMRCRFLFQEFQASTQINGLACQVRCGDESLCLACLGSSPPIKEPRQKTYNQGSEGSRGCRNSAPIKNTRCAHRITSYPSGPIHVQVTCPCAVGTFSHAQQRQVTEHA